MFREVRGISVVTDRISNAHDIPSLLQTATRIGGADHTRPRRRALDQAEERDLEG